MLNALPRALAEHDLLLGICSLRRLLRLRNDPLTGADARLHARRWIAVIRAAQSVLSRPA